MANPIVRVLEQAAQRIGRAAGEDASRAIQRLYRSGSDGLRGVVRNAQGADQAAERGLRAGARLPAQVSSGRGAGSDAGRLARALAGEADRKPSDLLRHQDGVPGAGVGTKRLGVLDEARVSRANGLITKVDGRPVGDYLNSLSAERAGLYREAKESGALSRNKQGNCIATGLDRRTGVVYEGVNGPSKDVVQQEDLHPTLRANYERLHQAGPYVSTKDGSKGHEWPYEDKPLGHAEVKATNHALHARSEAGLPTDHAALGELTMAPRFPFIKDGQPAPFCPNCDGILNGVESTTGRLAALPDSGRTGG